MTLFETVRAALLLSGRRCVFSLKEAIRKSPLLLFYARKVRVLWALAALKVHTGKFAAYDGDLFSAYLDFCKKSGLLYSQLGVGVIDEKDLNTNDIDDRIEAIAFRFFAAHRNLFSKPAASSASSKVGVLFTELYATGGHTPLVENLVYSLCGSYDLQIFCTRKTFTLVGDYRKKKDNLTDHFPINGVDWDGGAQSLAENVYQYYNQIVESGCGILFCYIHPHDVVTTATLALIKKYTNIKIVDINIQDHFYSLGFKFAHLIIDARPAGQHLTRDIRGYHNTILMPPQKTSDKKTIFHSAEEKNALRASLGIQPGELFTLTGTADYKIFDNGKSPYLEMIKDLLLAEPKLKHVLMTELSVDGAQNIIDSIFTDKALAERFIIINRVAAYDLYMQACDFFIDSFPQGGATIHIDMMRNKRPTVLKINKEMPLRSFEFYLPKDYAYQYAAIEDMKAGILHLLHSPEEQERMAAILHEHYKANYEYEVVLNKYKALIENRDRLESFYESQE